VLLGKVSSVEKSHFYTFPTQSFPKKPPSLDFESSSALANPALELA
jgi:hypothetical protein